MWKDGKWVTWAVYVSQCNPVTTCPICWNNDREIWRADDAQEWIYGGKAHKHCRCNFLWYNNAEITEWIQINGYDRPP